MDVRRLRVEQGERGVEELAAHEEARVRHVERDFPFELGTRTRDDGVVCAEPRARHELEDALFVALAEDGARDGGGGGGGGGALCGARGCGHVRLGARPVRRGEAHGCGGWVVALGAQARERRAVSSLRACGSAHRGDGHRRARHRHRVGVRFGGVADPTWKPSPVAPHLPVIELEDPEAVARAACADARMSLAAKR